VLRRLVPPHLLILSVPVSFACSPQGPVSYGANILKPHAWKAAMGEMQSAHGMDLRRLDTSAAVGSLDEDRSPEWANGNYRARVYWSEEYECGFINSSRDQSNPDILRGIPGRSWG